MAAEPRQRRAAARRRPARLLAAARPRRADAPPSGAPTTTSPAPPARSARRACRTRSPSAWSTVNDRESSQPGRQTTLGPSQRPRQSAPARCCSPGCSASRAALLVACGSSGKGLIPTANAGPLQSDFEAVAQAAQSGEGSCTATEAAIEKTESDFAALPATVDAGLRKTLSVGHRQPAPPRARAVRAAAPADDLDDEDEHHPRRRRAPRRRPPTTTTHTETTTTPTTPTTTAADRHHPGRRHARARAPKANPARPADREAAPASAVKAAPERRARARARAAHRKAAK